MRFDSLFSKMQPVVFFGSAAVVVGFCIFGGAFTSLASKVFEGLQSRIVDVFGWYYVLSATGFLLFCLWLLFSPLARLRLGGEDDRPEFGYVAWFVMLFAAGMGIGLVFWGVAEPLNH